MIHIISNNPIDHIEVALAVEILAYHNKNCLDSTLCENSTRSEFLQKELKEAIRCLKEKKEDRLQK